MESILVTLLTSQLEMSWLNEPLDSNSDDMSVTSEVSHEGMSAPHAAPQFAPAEEQHCSPEGTIARHLSTAALSAADDGKGDEVLPEQPEDVALTQAPGGPSYKPLDAGYVAAAHTNVSDLS